MIQKSVASIVLVCLLALSMFTSVVPFGSSQEPYMLMVEAAVDGTITSYERSVMIHPDEQDLQFIPVSVYLADWCEDGGVMMETPAFYFDLMESTNYEVKVPISAVFGRWDVLFEHWEVWDQTTDEELEWLNGINEEHIYAGSWWQDGVEYNRITKLIATPKYNRTIRPEIEHNLEAKYQGAQKELLDIEDGIYGPPGVLEPYLRFGIHNPVGGGDKKLIAVYHLQWGPETEHMYFRTIPGSDNAVNAFLLGEIDVLTDLTQTSHIDALDDFGAVITSAHGFHMCYIGSNLRLQWMGPQDGGGPGASLRQAMAHLLPKDTLIVRLFQYIVARLDTFVPPALEEWYNPNVATYEYNPVAAYNTLVAGGWEYRDDYGTWWHPLTGIAGGDDRIVQVLSPLMIVAPTSVAIVTRYVNELNALADPATGDPTPIAAQRVPMDFWSMVVRVFLTRDFEQYFLCWSDLDTPEFLYEFFHSSNDIPWGDNSPGIRSFELDEQLEIVMFSPDREAQLAACTQAQVLLSNMLPYIPIYSRNYFNAHRPDYYGAVLSPGFGIKNYWTFTNIKGPRESGLYVPPLTQIQGNETIWHLAEHVESYNPAEAGSAYAWTALDTIYDRLIGLNPYTLRDKPWLAEDWQIVGPVTMITPNGVSIVDGMYIEFALDDRVVNGEVLWHDGEVFNAEDIMFSWRYVWDNGLTNFYGFWQTLADIYSPDPTTVVAYWNTFSRWLLHDAAETATLFAPQVWGYIDSDGDTLNYLDDGDIEGDLSIRAYQPEDHARSDLGGYPAQLAFPWLRQAIGQGPYVLYDASEDGFDTHLFAFDTRSHTTVALDVHYWKSKAEIKEQKVEMFYHIGDVSLDAIVSILDLARIASHYLETGPTYPGGDYRGFIQEDVREDGIINLLDLATAGKHYGKEKEY